jgi:hypothetical protein
MITDETLGLFFHEKFFGYNLYTAIQVNTCLRV